MTHAWRINTVSTGKSASQLKLKQEDYLNIAFVSKGDVGLYISTFRLTLQLAADTDPSDL
jgi:hypothetical protein